MTVELYSRASKSLNNDDLLSSEGFILLRRDNGQKPLNCQGYSGILVFIQMNSDDCQNDTQQKRIIE